MKCQYCRRRRAVSMVGLFYLCRICAEYTTLAEEVDDEKTVDASP